MPLGIPADLTATQEVWGGTVTLNWTDTPQDCTPPPSFTATGGDGTGLPDTTIKSSVKQWTLNSFGNVSWGVSGTGASIDQNGNLTTTALACGTITITATDSCCGGFTQKVRVTDAGAWFLQEHIIDTTYGTCVGTGGHPPYTHTCNLVSGEQKTTYQWIEDGYTCGSYTGPNCMNAVYTCLVGNSIANNPCTGVAFSPAAHCCDSGATMLFRVLLDTYIYRWCCIGGC